MDWIRHGHTNTANPQNLGSAITDHLLWLCDLARIIWFGSALGLRVTDDDSRGFTETLSHWLVDQPSLGSQSHTFIVHVAAILWSIWLTRNKLIFDNVVSNPLSVIPQAKNWTNSILQAFSQKQQVTHQHPTLRHSWNLNFAPVQPIIQHDELQRSSSSPYVVQFSAKICKRTNTYASAIVVQQQDSVKLVWSRLCPAAHKMTGMIYGSGCDVEYDECSRPKCFFLHKPRGH